jgi:hypothetical protein
MTKPAQQVRAKIVLGDDVVKQEIAFIDTAIDVASDKEQISTIISSGSTIAGNYSYADWWYLEEIFSYGISYRGGEVAGGGSIGRIPGITTMTMEQVNEVIPSEHKLRHKQINAVLGHFRKFGYQIHPGNYFNAETSEPIKWFIDWNNTVFDHVHIIDDTLVIGKPDQIAPNGEGPAPVGPLVPIEERLPVYQYPQTRIEFFGLGNKARAAVKLNPGYPEWPDPLDFVGLDTAINTEMDSISTSVSTTVSVDTGTGDGSGSGTGDLTSGGQIGATVKTEFDKVAERFGIVEETLNVMQNANNLAMDAIGNHGLVRGEFDLEGNDFSIAPGIKNTSGKGKDLANLEKYK